MQLNPDSSLRRSTPARSGPDHQVPYRDIGRRLEAFRRGSNLSATDLARHLGVSRSNLYRIEQGEIVKIETVFQIAELLETSVNTLLGCGSEFIPQAGIFFERVRQLEAKAHKITNFFGPISYLLTSNAYDDLLSDVLMESPEPGTDRHASYRRVNAILATLTERKANYRARRPDLISLVFYDELEKFLATGAAPQREFSPTLRKRFSRVIFDEAERIASIMEKLPLNVSAGIFPEPLHSTPFQITSQIGGGTDLQMSPFRLASIPNINLGVAMVTDNPDAINYHNAMAHKLWSRSIKGKDGARLVKSLIADVA